MDLEDGETIFKISNHVHLPPCLVQAESSLPVICGHLGKKNMTHKLCLYWITLSKWDCIYFMFEYEQNWGGILEDYWMMVACRILQNPSLEKEHFSLSFAFRDASSSKQSSWMKRQMRSTPTKVQTIWYKILALANFTDMRWVHYQIDYVQSSGPKIYEQSHSGPKIYKEIWGPFGNFQLINKS